MRDNPIHERAFGADPGRREAALTRLFGAVLGGHVERGTILGAFSSGTLVGVCSMVPPGGCQLSGMRQASDDSDARRRRRPRSPHCGRCSWAGAWARHDPKAPHWHLGPVGVERALQGKGVGGALLRAFCARMDEDRAMAYLETDKPENVAIYEHFGFRTVAEDQVLGIPNWFMVRNAG